MMCPTFLVGSFNFSLLSAASRSNTGTAVAFCTWNHHHLNLFRRPATASVLLQSIFDNTNSPDNTDDIPDHLLSELYAAEAATPTSRTRRQRVVTYLLLTALGVTIGFFNAFLTELRSGEGAPSTSLDYYGFGWVEGNLLSSFFLMNKVGGALGLLGAGVMGTMAEIRSKKENVKRIWEEMKRRKESRDIGSIRNNKNRKLKQTSASKRDMTGIQKKRLAAIEELMVVEIENEYEKKKRESFVDHEPLLSSSSLKTKSMDNNDGYASSTEQTQSKFKEDPEKLTSVTGTIGFLDSLQELYKKADSMAVSQALLLNKELEERGMLDKITDETGLKVIGRDAAAKLTESQAKEE